MSYSESQASFRVEKSLGTDFDLRAVFSTATVGTPGGFQGGDLLRVTVTNDHGSAVTVTWAGAYLFAGGTPPALGTTYGDDVTVVFALFGGTAIELVRY